MLAVIIQKLDGRDQLLSFAFADAMFYQFSTCVRFGVQAKRFRREGHMYDGRPVSKWMGDESEQRAVFVDETACVGCRHCTYCAPNTFSMVPPPFQDQQKFHS